MIYIAARHNIFSLEVILKEKGGGPIVPLGKYPKSEVMSDRDT